MNSTAIALIGWGISIIVAVFIYYRKDGVEKTQIKGSVSELKTAFHARCEYSDLEREGINQRLAILEANNTKHYEQFTQAIQEMNGLLNENKQLIGEHLAYHKGKESK